MAILTSEIIQKRMLEGISGELPEEEFLKLEEYLKLAKGINQEESKDAKRKFAEIYKKKINKEIIRKKMNVYSIKQYQEKEKLSNEDELPILFTNFNIDDLQPANYDLHLGKNYYVTTEKHPKDLEKAEDTVVIEPGEFGILTTDEYIYVPEDLLGLISLRFTYKKQGLINISGFHVDPGYYGIIVFSVYNTGPKSIVLRYKEPVFMIMFEKLEKPILKRKGEPYENIPVDIITSLKGPSVSVINLDKRLRKVETYIKVYGGLAIALFILFISLLFGLLNLLSGITGRIP